MKKDMLFGWQSVFSFTLQQLLKSKAVIASLVLLLLLALGALPVMSIMQGGGNDVKTETSISKILIVDETELGIAGWLDLSKEEYDGVLPQTITFTDDSFDKLTEELKAVTKEDDNSVVGVRISYSKEEASFSVLGTYSANGNASKEDVSDIVSLIGYSVKNQLVNQRGISQEQLDYINADVEMETETFTLKADENDVHEGDEDENNTNINFAEYGIILAILCIIIMLVTTCAEQVAATVLQEKASKVVEILLTSVKPLALLVGKILAAYVLSMIYVASIVCGLYVSTLIVKVVNPSSTATIGELFAGSMTGGEAIGGVESTVSLQPFMIPFAILLILLGVLFYSVVAALAGASVSRMEELTEGMKVFTGILVVSAYFGMAVAMFDMAGQAPTAMRYIAFLCPLSAPFITSGYMMLGKISAGIGFASLGIMIIGTIVLCWFAATVYESLIYYKGEKLKLKDLLMLSKRERSAHHEK